MLSYAGYGFYADCVASTDVERLAVCSDVNDYTGADAPTGHGGPPAHPPLAACPQKTTVAKPASPRKNKHLKLYTEQPPKTPRPPIESVASLPDLLRTFQATTGWAIQNQSGTLCLETPAEDEKKEKGQQNWETVISNPQSRIPNPLPPIPRPAAQRLAGSIGELLAELLLTRDALWRREAELAAGVPLVPYREPEKHLAVRLEAALRAGAEAVGGDAIALYLLDEGTSELKLRSAWGLPFDRLVASARPLKGAVADLEALLGHAVVLTDKRVIRMWNMPEEFPTAVCVPVSTPTTLLGTLWLFSNDKRDFNDRETNILEVVAGRVASDLEREMLLRSAADGAAIQKQVAAAERLQRNELPTISPLLDGWNVAGWTSQAAGVGGAFHDWFCLPRGLLAATVGKAAEKGVPGALIANAVKTAVRAHSQYHRQAERVLQKVNLTLWTGSAGDQRSELFCGLIETATGRVCCSSAGKLSVLRLHSEGWESLSQPSPCLGESAEVEFEQFGYELQPGEALLIFSDSPCGAADGKNRPLGEATMAEVLRGKLHLSAEELVAAARQALSSHVGDLQGQDLTILAVKRTPA